MDFKFELNKITSKFARSALSLLLLSDSHQTNPYIYVSETGSESTGVVTYVYCLIRQVKRLVKKPITVNKKATVNCGYAMGC